MTRPSLARPVARVGLTRPLATTLLCLAVASSGCRDGAESPQAGAGGSAMQAGNGGAPGAGDQPAAPVAGELEGEAGESAGGAAAPLAGNPAAGTAGSNLDAGAAGSTATAGSGSQAGSAGDTTGEVPDGGAAGMAPIDAPVPDECITDVSAGDHTFTCGGLTFLVKVDEMCTKFACGLIFDVHGGTMSGAQMRDNTHLHELAPPHGYLVVHPSATPANTGGSWDLAAHPPIIGDFMDRMIAAFHVDAARIHVTGFSQGSAVTFWFLCHKNDILASTAPISGRSADQITAPGGGSCLESIDGNWEPRPPILFMSGTTDTALVIDDARARIDGLVQRLTLEGGEQIDGDSAYRRTRYTGADAMVLDYLEHDYGGQPVLAGHCIPGGTDIAGSANNFVLNATTCTTGDIRINWGELALQWFLEHPKR